MKENSPKLGQLITHHQERDAIHFAVAPVTCGPQSLKPGWFVKFHIPGNTEIVRVCEPAEAVGIIDPFLTVSVHPGQSCWMMLMPNTITGLRHEWTHPAFEEEQRGISEFWLREFAQKQDDLSYDDMMEQLKTGRGVFHGNDLNYEHLTDDDLEQLKHHFRIVTGTELRNTDFSCAC